MARLFPTATECVGKSDGPIIGRREQRQCLRHHWASVLSFLPLNRLRRAKTDGGLTHNVRLNDPTANLPPQTRIPIGHQAIAKPCTGGSANTQ